MVHTQLKHCASEAAASVESLLKPCVSEITFIITDCLTVLLTAVLHEAPVIKVCLLQRNIDQMRFTFKVQCFFITNSLCNGREMFYLPDCVML